jgi:hypothetical protein
MFLLQFLVDNFYLSVVLFMTMVLVIQFIRKEKKHAKAKLKMAKSKARAFSGFFLLKHRSKNQPRASGSG